MAEWTGKLVHLDLGTGVWVLETDGRRFGLHGKIPAELEGAWVRVRGERFEGVSTGMVGEALIAVEEVEQKS